VRAWSFARPPTRVHSALNPGSTRAENSSVITDIGLPGWLERSGVGPENLLRDSPRVLQTGCTTVLGALRRQECAWRRVD
jgi:hypothetical protein